MLTRREAAQMRNWNIQIVAASPGYSLEKQLAINLTTKAYLMEAEVEGGLRHPTQVEALL